VLYKTVNVFGSTANLVENKFSLNNYSLLNLRLNIVY